MPPKIYTIVVWKGLGLEHFVQKTNLQILLRIICGSKQTGPLLSLCVSYPLCHVNTQLLLPFQGFRCRFIVTPFIPKICSFIWGAEGDLRCYFSCIRAFEIKSRRPQLHTSHCPELSLLQCNTAPCWRIQGSILSQGWGCPCVSNTDREVWWWWWWWWWQLLIPISQWPLSGGWTRGLVFVMRTCGSSLLLAKMGSYLWGGKNKTKQR